VLVDQKLLDKKKGCNLLLVLLGGGILCFVYCSFKISVFFLATFNFPRPVSCFFFPQLKIKVENILSRGSIILVEPPINQVRALRFF